MSWRAGVAGLVVLVALGQGVAYYRGAAITARAELAVTRQHLEGMQEAARISAQHAIAAREERDYWRGVAADIERAEGAEDQLSPYLRAVLDGVRSARPAGSDPARAPVSGGGGVPGR